MTRHRLVIPLLAVTAFWSTAAFAQTSSMFGQSASRTGSSTSSRSSASGGFSSFSNSRQQTGLNTQSGFGQQQSGRTGTSNMGQQTAGTARQGLVGRADTAGRLVGSANAGQQNFGTGSNALGQQFGTRSRGLNRQSNLFGGMGDDAFGGSGNGTNANGYRVPIPQQKVAFEYRERPAPEVSQRISTQLDKVSQRLAIRGIALSVDEGTVTLRGSVKSEGDRRLAEQLVRLEPGVRQVVNELAVTP
jgi:osmotically-inducible protein OsmY